MTTTKMTIKPGEQFHFLASGFTFATSVGFLGTGTVSTRGRTVTATQALLDASHDKNGASWLDLVDDPQAQTARWGHEVFGRGNAPEGIESWVPGDPEWYSQREEARSAAWSLPTGRARKDALAAVQARFGAAPRTSKTILNVTGDDAS
ncbi:MAG: hypothetical protein ACOH17_00725 [Cellulomonas sp.]